MYTPACPPITRWVRLSEAAARVGLPPRVLKTCISAGTACIRSQQLGPRGLTYCAEADIPQFADRLSRTGSAR
jgi:hypothetical protein